MHTFNIILTRWDGAERRQSEPIRITAESFHQACETAHSMLLTAKTTDPDRDYDVASVTADGLRGIDCTHGFLTDAEYTNHLQPTID